MNRLITLIREVAVAVAVLIAMSSCNPLRGSIVATSGDGEILATLEVSRGQYRTGETIEVTFTIENTTGQVVILEREDGPVQDIIVAIDGVERRWTTEIGQAEAIDYLRLEPGEKSTINWSLADVDVSDERFAGMWWSSNRREAVVMAGGAYGPPVATLIPTATLTATRIPPPTPKKRPCECVILCAVGASSSTAQSSGSSLVTHAQGLLSVLMPQTAELWDGVELLQKVRDRILAKSPEGRRYIDLYTARSPELALILLADDELRERGFETIDLFRPGFEALLEGRGNELVITAAQVSAVGQFLNEIAAAASPGLAQVIADERAAKPLGQLSGMTIAEGLSDLTDNEPPEADAGTGYVVEEGGFIELQGAGNDPEGDPLTFEWDLNDDGRYDVTDQSVVFAAIDLDGPSILPVALRVCDDKAGCAVSETTVQILNSAPLVAIHDPSGGNEGDPIAFDGIFLEYGTDTHMIEWDFGDGSNAAGLLEPEHIFSDDGDYQVTLTVTDDDGGTGSHSVFVTIANAPPVLGEITPSAVPAQVGLPIVFSATISDPGSADSHSGTWDWGDGTVTAPATVVDDAAGRRVEDSHTYDLPGIYTIQLQVSDDDGAVDTKNLTDVNVIQIIEVDIDIKPGGNPNSISPNSKGKIPEAILPSLDFDASNRWIMTLAHSVGLATKSHFTSEETTRPIVMWRT